MQGLSSSDLKILATSKHVVKITSKQIIFTEDFKCLVLDTQVEGLTREETFNRALGVNCFGKKFVDTCLGRWRRKLRFAGSLTSPRKGRGKDLHNMTLEELMAENAYQKEVIAHLKKLRGLAGDEL